MLNIFYGCTGLTSIAIPYSVTSIGYDAFLGCRNLTAISVESGNPIYDSRENCNAIIETANNNLIKGCYNTIIPNSLTGIGFGAFSGCDNLTSIMIPNGVTSIGWYAFQDCYGLTSITIPNSVTSIDDGVFWGCSGLTNVVIGSCVTSIGENAFYDCSNLTSVTVEMMTPVAIGSSTFSNSTNATLYVPYGSKDIYEASDYWKDFKEIVEMSPTIEFADANVKALCVANWDTNGDGELSEEEAAAVTSLRSVFKENTTIKSFDELQYFTGLTSIESQSFYSCRSLTSIRIPCNVTTIGESAFMWCKLSSLTIPKSVINIETSAFLDCGISLTTINVEKGNTKYDSRDNCNAIIETETNTLLWGCNSTIIPSSVTSIGNSAFSHCMELSSVSLPDGITSIGNWAFYNCVSLTSINIPDNVVSIGEDAFWKCDNLTSVNIGINVASIGQWAFSDCSNLHSVISEIEEPFSFGSKAFYGIAPTCTLTVPYGTKDAYIAVGWTEDVFKGGIIETPLYRLIYKVGDEVYKTYEVKYGTAVTPEEEPTKEGYTFSGWSEIPEMMPDHDVVVTGWFCSTANRMEIKPKEVCIGRTAVLPVELINDAAVKAFEFEVSLPDGIKLTDCELTTRKGSDHKVYVSQLANGKYKVMSYATPSMAFSGNEGEIVNLILDVSSTMAKGVYNVSIKNIEMTSTDVAAIILTNVSAQLIVKEILPGDANGDGRVSVTDVVSIVDYITGNPPAQFVADAADANGDGIINIFDVTKTVNIILGFDDEEETESKAREDAHTSSATLFTSMENGRTDLMLERADDFIAMQFDVVVPEGTELLDVRLHSVADHAMAFGRTGENRYTVIAYSMSNATFRTTDDALVTLLLSDEKAASIENATFVTKDGRCVGMDVANLCTGIATVKGERSSDAVYTLSGQFVGTDKKPLSKGVYIRGGRKIIVK